METLICKSLLWKIGLITSDDYNIALDKMFLKKDDSDILLELECCSSKCDATFEILYNYWKYDCKDFSVDIFGKDLLIELKRVYKSNTFTIKEFSSKCYLLWTYLPTEINTKEPFHILSYADDCLSYGDEAQTRKLYEELFDFYD